MRSIVFSKFSDKYFEEEIHTKLKVLDVDVVRVVRLEEDIHLNTDDFDSIIILQDMTIKSQQDLMKEFAKKYKKPFVSLTRRNPNFDNELSGAIKKLNVSIAPSSPSVEIATTMRAVVDLITNPKPIPTEELQDIVLPQESEGVLGEKDLALVIANTTLTELREYIEALEEDNKKLSDELKKSQETASELLTERNLILGQYNSSMSGNRFLNERLEKLTLDRNTGANIQREIRLIRKSREEGSISDHGALERLLLIGDDHDS